MQTCRPGVLRRQGAQTLPYPEKPFRVLEGLEPSGLLLAGQLLLVPALNPQPALASYGLLIVVVGI